MDFGFSCLIYARNMKQNYQNNYKHFQNLGCKKKEVLMCEFFCASGVLVLHMTQHTTCQIINMDNYFFGTCFIKIKT
jgi:hypothetical protein